MLEDKPPMGWHSRGYLPHFDAPGQIQALTFRLIDSVPKHVIESWRQELGHLADSPADLEMRLRITRYEDRGHGECLLRIPSNAEAVESCLFHADGARYRLIDWCVMPNHVHVMIEPFPRMTLGEIVRTWKTYSARQINRFMGRSGSVWAADYHDRYIRDMKHFAAAKDYVRRNPVKAGLCQSPEGWPWSSATRR
jgi:REP element-mobilizing transposase RayT